MVAAACTGRRTRWATVGDDPALALRAGAAARRGAEPRRPSLAHRGEAVAYIGGGSKWSVSRRLICRGALPEGLRTAHFVWGSEMGRGAGLMRQPQAKAVAPVAIARCGVGAAAEVCRPQRGGGDARGSSRESSTPRRTGRPIGPRVGVGTSKRSDRGASGRPERLIAGLPPRVVQILSQNGRKNGHPCEEKRVRSGSVPYRRRAGRQASARAQAAGGRVPAA